MWINRGPDLSNYAIHPGIRIPSRLYTSPSPFLQSKYPFPQSQFKRAKNLTKAHPQLLMTLNDTKNLFTKQLPNMGAPYITRLVFDMGAETVLMLHSGVPTAAICSKFFFEQGFVEIVFCAVDSDHQACGYGRMIMNTLKNLLQTYEIYDILTCADNDAVQYFKKQGFNDKEILMNPKRWIGYIKDYDFVTLVHCRIFPDIDYIRFNETLEKQISRMNEKLGIKIQKPLQETIPYFISFPYSPLFNNISLPDLIKKTGFTPIDNTVLSRINGDYIQTMQDSKQKYIKILGVLQTDEAFESLFQKPVTEELAPGYFDEIKQPMDFWTIEKRLRRYNDYYKTPEQFASDIVLICNNCKKYNGSESVYYKTANDLLRKFRHLYHNEFPNSRGIPQPN